VDAWLFEKAEAGLPAAARGSWEISEEVENSKGVGATPRSGSQVQSDRHPEVRRARGPGCFRASRYTGEQAHEGRAQAQRLSRNTSEGEKVRRASARGMLNRAPSSTNALPEQGSEVAGSCLSRALRAAFREPTAPGSVSASTPTGFWPLPAIRLASASGMEGRCRVRAGDAGLKFRASFGQR
jgi:hypothetical protein